MDGQDYNNLNNKNDDFIDKPDKDYPSENEIISSQNNNSENTPTDNYCPPPAPIELNQPTKPSNVKPNPPPQAPYLKYGPIYNANNINPIPPQPPQPIPVGNNISYQPVNYNQNAVVVPVQQQIIYQQPIVQVQPNYDQIRIENERKRRQQQQDQEDCANCCLVLCYCLLCCCMLAGGGH